MLNTEFFKIKPFFSKDLERKKKKKKIILKDVIELTKFENIRKFVGLKKW